MVQCGILKVLRLCDSLNECNKHSTLDKILVGKTALYEYACNGKPIVIIHVPGFMLITGPPAITIYIA